MAAFGGLSSAEIKSKREELYEFTGLGDALLREVRTYSSGMRTKLLASIVFHLEADVLLFDEFFSSLDEDFKNKLRTLLDEIRRRREMTVIIASHNTELLQAHCDRTMILVEGKHTDTRAPGDPSWVE